MKRIAELTCPECQKPIKVPFDEKEPPTLDEITNTLNEALKGNPTAEQIQKVIQEQIEGLKPPKDEHRHKTADEFLDCPECREWVDKTAQRYQVVAKEPPPPEKKKEPEPAEPAFGSVFGAKTGGEHE